MTTWLVWESDNLPAPPPTPIPPPTPPPGGGQPVPVRYQRGVELPYHIFRKTDNSSYAIMGVKPAADQTGAQIHVNEIRDATINNFAFQESLITLNGFISRTDKTLKVSPANRIAFGDALLINDEFVRVDSVTHDATQSVATISRGIYDTVPNHHASTTQYKTPVWVFFNHSAKDFGVFDNLGIKILTSTTQGTLDIGAATQYNLALADRGARPLNVANVRVNGVYTPSNVEGDITFTYLSRNKFTQRQRADVVGFFDPTSYEPESNIVVSILLDAAGKGNYGIDIFQVRNGSVTITAAELESAFGSRSALVNAEIKTFYRGGEHGGKESFQTYTIPTFHWLATPRIVLRFGGGGSGAFRNALRFQEAVQPPAPPTPRHALRFFETGVAPSVTHELRFSVGQAAPPSVTHALRFKAAIPSQACGQYEHNLFVQTPTGSASGACLTSEDGNVRLHTIIGTTVRRFNMSPGVKPVLDTTWNIPSPTGAKYLEWDETEQRFMFVNPSSRAVSYTQYDGTVDAGKAWSLHADNANAVALIVRNAKLYVADGVDDKMYAYDLASATRGTRQTSDEWNFPTGADVTTACTDGETTWLINSNRTVWAQPFGGGVRNRFREFTLNVNNNAASGVRIYDDQFFVVNA